jgi:formylglycine-generating enzyme required for sulfatase activity
MIASLVLLATLAVAPVLAEPPCLDDDRMAFVPAGRFWMGSGPVERALAARLTPGADWLRSEPARRRITLPAYCIDRFLVTHAEYALFVTATRHPRPAAGPGASLRPDRKPEESDRQVARYLWHRGEPPDSRSRHPVVLVRAADAEAYCRWRHSSFRLPTEAQWERAARGDHGRVFPWGNRWSPSRLNSADSERLPVDVDDPGRQPPRAQGLRVGRSRGRLSPGPAPRARRRRRRRPARLSLRRAARGTVSRSLRPRPHGRRIA